jgi:hypothetical protein
MPPLHGNTLAPLRPASQVGGKLIPYREPSLHGLQMKIQEQQPLSVEGQVGVNLALGVAGLMLAR